MSSWLWSLKRWSTAPSIWNPPREGGSAIRWNFEMWTNLEMVSSHCLVLELWACLGLLLSFCVQWPHFIGDLPCCPAIWLWQGCHHSVLFSPLHRGGTVTQAGPSLIDWGARAASNLLIWKEPDCGVKPSRAKHQSLDDIIWTSASGFRHVFLFAYEWQPRISRLPHFAFFFLLVKQHILEMTPYQCMESTPIYSYNYAILHCVGVSIADSTTSLLMAIWGYFQSFPISNARAFIFSHSC